MTRRTEVPVEFQPTEPLATERQVSYIHSLLDSKQLTADPRWFDATNAMDADEYAAYIARVKEQVKTISKSRASEIIDSLVALPFAQKEQPMLLARDADKRKTHVVYEDVETDAGERRIGFIQGGDLVNRIPAGRYALDTSADERFANDTTFFNVWVGDRGGWNVKFYRSDELTPMGFPLQQDVLMHISRDPSKASALYGHHSSRCGVCGRKLTNDESRERGIGPVCAGRMAW